MKKFDIPVQFQSSFMGKLKMMRRTMDPRKKDWTPTQIQAGSLTLIFPRHMGFCYGVENAIEIAFRAVHENPGKRVFLLGEMIHNPAVNEDLKSLGVSFIMDTAGNRLIDWNTLSNEDIVITPAFGTTLEIDDELQSIGVDVRRYNTTCPFVEKVWKRSNEIGKEGYTIVIHGKYKHEETRATFSHANQNAKSIVVRDMKEVKWLTDYMLGNSSVKEFYERFEGKCTLGFDPDVDLKRIGVVNQTTMLATETEEISQYLKGVVTQLYGDGSFADTRDTLCYATNENQMAALELLRQEADMALVIGGYNSSNTFQLATILNQKMKTYFIESADCIDGGIISFFDLNQMKVVTEENPTWLDKKRICIASGASCPDTLVDQLVGKLMEERNERFDPELWVNQWKESVDQNIG
jgi:4-hydroxy-3-methylbut-2-enyl diphosphate reductase